MSSHRLTNGLKAILAVAVLVFCAASLWGQTPAAHKPGPRPVAQKSSPISRAQALLQKGDLAGAESVAWEVLASTPDDKDALTLLGIIRGQQQRYPEAESLFRRVVELDPASASANRNLGQALMVQGKVEAALQQYVEAEKRSPSNPEIELELARLYLMKQQYQDALAALDKVPREKSPAAAIPVRAAALIGAGRKPEAAALATRVGTAPALELALAEVYIRGGLPDDGLNLLQQISQEKNLPPGFYYLKGQALLGKGQADAATTNFRRALSLDPKSLDATMALAEASALQGKHAESLQSLQKARELAPDALPVLRHVIIEGEAAGQASVAVAAARELVQKSPEDLDDAFLASAAMLQGGDSIGARVALRNYTQHRPDDAKGWLGLGMASLVQKGYDEARTALERSAQLAPNQPETEFQLGVLAREESKQAESIEHFEHTLALNPSHPGALAQLGALYLQAGQLDKAQDVLQKSVAADPRNPDTEYKLAMVLSKLGKTEEARQHMQRFQALKSGAAPSTTIGTPR